MALKRSISPIMPATRRGIGFEADALPNRNLSRPRNAHQRDAVVDTLDGVERGLESLLLLLGLGLLLDNGVVLDGRVVGGVGLGSLLLSRLLRLGHGLGGDLDRGAVGHVDGGEGVLAAPVGGDVGLGAVGSHGLDGSDLLTVIGRNRELEVKGAVDHRGLVGRVGGDTLLATLVIGERGTGNVEGQRGGGVLDDGRGLVGGLRRRAGSRRGSLGLDGLDRGLGRGGLDGLGRLDLLLRLHRLRSLLVGLRFRSLRNRGGLGLRLFGHSRLNRLGRRVHNDLLGPVGRALGQALCKGLNVGGLHHEHDAQEDREHGLALLHQLVPPAITALAPLAHTNHPFNATDAARRRPLAYS